MNSRFVLLILLSVVIYFANLGGSSIYILDEAKNAGCAMEMSQRNDLVIPTFNGKLRTDKPPLHYFFMMAAYKIAGVSSLTARFFSALAGVLLVVLLYQKVSKIINERTAFFTVLVMLSSLQLAVQFHLAVPDPYLILLIALCLLSFFTGFQKKDADIYVMYIAAALAFVTKGLIGIVFPGLIILLYLLFTRQFSVSSFKKLRIPVGIVLFLIIGLPWYVAVGFATEGEWLRGFFIDHNVNRYTATMEGHRGFPLAPFAILIGALLPFSFFILQAVSHAWKKQKEHTFLLFCLITVVVVAGFFSFSKTVLPSYPAPAIPFLAIVVGYYLNHLCSHEHFSRLKMNITFVVALVISVAIPVGVYIALNQEQQLSHLSPLAYGFGVIPLGTLAGWYLFYRGKRAFFIYTWCGAWMLASLFFFYIAFPKVDQENPIAQSMPLVRKAYANYRMVAYKQFNPAYVFELKHPIEVIESEDQLRQLMNSQVKVVIISRTKYEEELIPLGMKMIYKGRDLFEGSETMLLTY